MAKEYLINNVSIRAFEVDRDAEPVKNIVGQVWSGGDDALMEERFGVIGKKSWKDLMGQSVLTSLKADRTRSFVAEKNCEIVGFSSYSIDTDRNRGTVGYNAVAPSQQGQGLGSAMMDFVMAAIEKEGMLYAAVIVADNEQHAPARRIYEKNGFQNMMELQYMVKKIEANEV